MAETNKTRQQQFCGFDIQVTRKPIRHAYLRIDPVSRQIRLSAPLNASDATLEQIIRKRSEWLRGKLALPVVVQQCLEFNSGDTFYHQGKPLSLLLVKGRRQVQFDPLAAQLVLQLPDPADRLLKERLVDRFQRQSLNDEIPALMESWQARIGVRASQWRLRRMKSRWGSCNIAAKRIWLNVELAKYGKDELEYVIVHELCHLLERYHNARFYRFMDQFLPDWRLRRQRLNRLPGGADSAS